LLRLDCLLAAAWQALALNNITTDNHGSPCKRLPHQSALQAQLQQHAESRAWNSASAILQSAAAETAAWKAQVAQQAAIIKQHEATISSLQLCQVGLAFFAKLQHLQHQQHSHQLQQDQEMMQHHLGLCGAALSEVQRLRSADADQVQQLQAVNLDLVCSTRSLKQRETQLLQRTDVLQQEAAHLQRTVAEQQQQVQELQALLQQQEQEQQLQHATAAAAATNNTVQLVQATADQLRGEFLITEDALKAQVDNVSSKLAALQQQLSEQQAVAAAAAACSTAHMMHKNLIYEHQLGDQSEPSCEDIKVIKQAGDVYYIQQTGQGKAGPPVLQLNAMYEADAASNDNDFMHSCTDSSCSCCESSSSGTGRWYVTDSDTGSTRSSIDGAVGGIGRYSCSSFCSSFS
jgi:hypothetical protein